MLSANDKIPGFINVIHQVIVTIAVKKSKLPGKCPVIFKVDVVIKFPYPIVKNFVFITGITVIGKIRGFVNFVINQQVGKAQVFGGISGSEFNINMNGAGLILKFYPEGQHRQITAFDG